MWYKSIMKRDYVWIANRDKPLLNSTGVLKFSEANLVLLNHFGNPIWSTNVTIRSPASPVVAELLANGNFVVRQLTSWKSDDDPSSGGFIYGISTHDALPQRFIWYVDSEPHHRSDSFNGIGSSGVPTNPQSNKTLFTFATTNESVTYSFRVTEDKVLAKLRMFSDGMLRQLWWSRETQAWISSWDEPVDQCDMYDSCYPDSYCDTDVDISVLTPACRCMEGFDKKGHSSLTSDSHCERKTPLSCDGDGFRQLKNMKLPDTKAVMVDRKIGIKECRAKCLKNCNCTAFSYMDTRNSGPGCLMWTGELVDLRTFSVGGQHLYIRLAANDLGDHRSISKKLLIGLIVGGVAVVVIVSFFLLWLWKMKHQRARAIDLTMNVVARNNKDLLGANQDSALEQMEFQTILMATNNFSYDNQLGEGGFGIVYKGTLLDGRNIAVKRLSQGTDQGTDEFRNEVVLISKVRHINLVRILGYCINAEEHLLIYEYLENLSLDSYLFGNTQSSKLDWHIRCKIINGIARGLQYLHHDSHSRIIHRDLKASNILLDKDMIPKISDFGMARLVGREEIEANTTRVVGTFGYMAPEYTTGGTYSVKSDVFSFGVLLLEILSGKKNSRFTNSNGDTSLLSYAWRSWEEGTWQEIVDPRIGDEMSISDIQEEIKECLQIGLLCVQGRPEDRPTMPVVVVMLESNAAMPQPKPPGYCARGFGTFEVGSSSTGQPANESWTRAEITVSVIEPR
ncbi:unnamed protein product [Microthlaspi erraticum]|uniref:Receptor-like serine/threonine-protein kinase n=1 Tax=Microthlaspi erraticum TaxID=1685480 RepID=A0A6D2KHR6_9BRAS|nr:unnamed protein product [Microthlaspi erraticum]